MNNNDTTLQDPQKIVDSFGKYSQSIFIRSFPKYDLWGDTVSWKKDQK